MTNIDLLPAIIADQKTKRQQQCTEKFLFGQVVNDTILHALNCSSTRVNELTMVPN